MNHFFFFFNDAETTEIYPLPLPAALPFLKRPATNCVPRVLRGWRRRQDLAEVIQRVFARALPLVHPLPHIADHVERSEEHTSELQSHSELVCRLLLEKKNNVYIKMHVIWG